MVLPRSLRALLGTLAVDLEDERVRELLILGAGSARVVRGHEETRKQTDLSPTRVAQLAARVERALGGRCEGLLDGGLEVRVLREASSSRGPFIRFRRRSGGIEPLARLVERGFVTEEFVRFIEATKAPLSLLLVGPRRSGKTTLLASIAVARASAERASGAERGATSRPGGRASSERVAVLDDPSGVLASSNAFDLVLGKMHGVEHALELDADLIVADELPPEGWRALFTSGRAFVASFEARGHEAALELLSARLLAADASLSRAAARALLRSSVDRVLELDRDPATGEAHVVGFRSPSFPVSSTNSTEDMPLLRVPTDDVAPPRTAEPSGVRAPNAEVVDRDKTPAPVASPRRVVPARRISVENQPSPPTPDRFPDPSPPLREERVVTNAPRPVANELSAMAGMPSMSVSPIPTTSFDNSELSGEIRPEQLMSDSFVMSLDHLPGVESLQRIVAVDIDAPGVDRSDSGQGAKERDGDDPMAGRPSPRTRAGESDVEDAPLVRPLPDLRAEGARAESSPRTESVPPQTPPASESSRPRRETPERTPTELVEPSAEEIHESLNTSPPVEENLAPSEFDSTQSANLGEMTFAPSLDEEGDLPSVPSSRPPRNESDGAAERSPTHLAREPTLDLGRPPSEPPSDRRFPARPSAVRTGVRAPSEERRVGRPDALRLGSLSGADRRSSRSEGLRSEPTRSAALRSELGRSEGARDGARSESDAARASESPRLDSATGDMPLATESHGGVAPLPSEREPKSRLPSLTGEEIEQMLGDLPDVGPEGDGDGARDDEGSGDAGPSDDEPGSGARRGTRSAPDLRPRRRLR